MRVLSVRFLEVAAAMWLTGPAGQSRTLQSAPEVGPNAYRQALATYPRGAEQLKGAVGTRNLP